MTGKGLGALQSHYLGTVYVFFAQGVNWVTLLQRDG